MIPKRSPSALVILVLSFALTGCTEAPPGPVLYDLVEQFQWVEVPQEAATASPRADLDKDALLLPSGQSVDFYLKVPNDQVLTIDRLGSSDEGTAALRVEFERAGETRCDLGRISPSNRPLTSPLPDGGSEICRLTLRAEGDGEFLMVRPRIRAATAPPVPAEMPEEMLEEGQGDGGPNIIVYLIDTLRADHLGTYGYDKPVSPNIDAFAAESFVFDNAVAQSAWTRASVASIFTGLEPHLHRVNSFKDALPKSALTLAEILSGTSYRTAAFYSNPNVAAEFGFEQGFDVFSAVGHKSHRLSQKLNEQVFPFLRNDGANQCFFLYIHSNEPHAPFAPPEQFKEVFAKDVPREMGQQSSLRKIRWEPDPSPETSEQVMSLYDAEIASTDRSFGLLMEELKTLGLYDNSVIILVADHGEEFWDHGVLGHTHTLYSELLTVPLIIKEPGAAKGQRVPDLVQHVDLFSTVLDYAGVELPESARGRSLRRLVRASKDTDPTSVYSFLSLRDVEAASVTEEEWKLIVPRSEKAGTEPKLFHLSSDREELENRFGEEPIVAGYLMTLLRMHESDEGDSLAASEAMLTDELVDNLRALGYVE